ncbi:hypothetical protein OCU04_003611 [Sclerotinia nivalis]|uniref:Uncharacterized protein n=1 Tax=Sclerotinia nivalis TaxID=352851 RepID=A0A9X0AT42_9HELO|nr:hypothetical protein OCU04_003611 [Sclerotinia nivalis]
MVRAARPRTYLKPYDRRSLPGQYNFKRPMNRVNGLRGRQVVPKDFSSEDGPGRNKLPAVMTPARWGATQFHFVLLFFNSLCLATLKCKETFKCNNLKIGFEFIALSALKGAFTSENLTDT